MSKLTVVLVLLMFVIGCVVQPTMESRSVRVVDAQSNYKCEFIALVTGSESWGSSPSYDVEGALNEVKNRAADIGANEIRFVNIDSSAYTSVVVAQALRCDQGAIQGTY